MTSPLPPRRLRVLHFITHLALGGAERFALDLSRGLTGEIDSGVFAVHGVAAGGLGASLRRELADAHLPLFSGSSHPLKSGGGLLASLHAAAAVRRFRPDLLHLHTEIPEAAAALMLAFTRVGRTTALVRTMHNSRYWTFWPRTGRWCDRRLRRARIAAVSRAALGGYEQLRASSGAGAPPEPPEIIYNGVPLQIAAAARRPPHTLTTTFRLLFAARFEPQKGADLIPEIARRVRLRPGQSCDLTIRGVGRCDGQLRAFAAAPPPGWIVRVAPPIAGLRDELTGFDFVLMPSRFEGLSLLAIEAALLRVAVVATASPGLDEALPTDHAWRARPDDATDFARVLTTALDAPDAQREDIVEAAFLHAHQRFDFDAMCARYAALYRRCRP